MNVDNDSKSPFSKKFSELYATYEERTKKDKSFMNNILFASKVVLLIPVLFLFYKFMTKDLFHLTTIKH